MGVSRQQLAAILKRQGHRCFLSGRPLTPSNVSVDHLVPLSRGGSQDASNLRLVTRGANQAKSNLLLEEFVELCRDVVSEDRRRKRRKGRTKRAALCRDVVSEDHRRKRRKGQAKRRVSKHMRNARIRRRQRRR